MGMLMYATRKSDALKEKKTAKPLMRMKSVVQKTPHMPSHGCRVLKYTFFVRSKPCAFKPRSILERKGVCVSKIYSMKEAKGGRRLTKLEVGQVDRPPGEETTHGRQVNEPVEHLLRAH